MYGFTYNGIHCSKFGLYYTQTAEEKWFADPEYDVYDEEVEWKNGGYYYGASAKNRTFALKCFFEEIDTVTRQKIKQWVKRGTSGRLLFDDKPFVYWNVRPGKIPVGNWYLDTDESHSGTVTITFTAYEPFGYLTRKSNGSPVDDSSADYCNLIDTADMPSAPATNSTAFDIYNPGTEDCGLTIEISGSTSNPIRFYNEANGTFCGFAGIPSNSLHLRIDGDTGYVSTFAAGSSTSENGFAYHDKGVVNLLPNNVSSGITYAYGGKSGTLYIFNLTGYVVSESMKGSKLTANNKTFTVESVSVENNRLYCSRSGSTTVPSSGTCTIQTLNHIVIQEKVSGSWTAPSTLSLSSISVDYNPRAL